MIGITQHQPRFGGVFYCLLFGRELVSVSKRVGGQGECNEPKAARVRE